MLKFIGKFKDLVPMGYVFQRLYAVGYKIYKKDHVLIWVAHREVTVNGLSRTNSASVAKLILDNTYPIYNEDICYGRMLFYERGEPRICMLDRQTGKVVSHTDFMKANNLNPEYDYERYRTFSFYKSLLDAVRELHKHKMIEIVS